MNTRLLRRVQKYILAEPKRIVMSTWGEVADSLRGWEKKERPACGTKACIAGWAMILSASDPNKYLGPEDESDKEAQKRQKRLDKLFYGRRGDAERLGADLLELTPEQGSRLFMDDYWPAQFMTSTSTPRAYAKQVAKRIDHFIQTKGAE